MEKSSANTVKSNAWLTASETEEGGGSVEKSDFSETLFLELTSILLSGQLRNYFATVGTSCPATVKFDMVGEKLYREAIDLILTGIDSAQAGAAEKARNDASMFDAELVASGAKKWKISSDGIRLPSMVALNMRFLNLTNPQSLLFFFLRKHSDISPCGLKSFNGVDQLSGAVVQLFDLGCMIHRDCF